MYHDRLATYDHDVRVCRVFVCVRMPTHFNVHAPVPEQANCRLETLRTPSHHPGPVICLLLVSWIVSPSYKPKRVEESKTEPVATELQKYLASYGVVIKHMFGTQSHYKHECTFGGTNPRSMASPIVTRSGTRDLAITHVNNKKLQLTFNCSSILRSPGKER